MQNAKRMRFPLLAVLCASLAACIASTDGATDGATDVADEPVARDEAPSNTAADVEELNISVDSVEDAVGAPDNDFACQNCKAKCYDWNYNFMGTWSRGPHTDCQATAEAFCWDAFGFPYGVGSCG